MTIRIFIVLLAISFLNGCSLTPRKTTPPTREPTSKEIEEMESYLKAGTSTVQGQVFMTTRGGDVIYGAGSPVYLLPMTKYASYKMQGEFDINISNDPVLVRYTRQKRADAAGNFEFSNVPAGDYLVISTVTWEAPTGYMTEASGSGHVTYQQQGGWMLTGGKVGPGETVKVVITR